MEKVKRVLEILADPDEKRVSLNLSRREAEFQGSTALLTDSKNAPAFAATEYLSVKFLRSVHARH